MFLALTMCRVLSTSGTCRLTKSLAFSTSSTDGARRRAELVLMEVLRADQDRPRILRLLHHRIALGRKALQPYLRDLVDYQDLALLRLNHASFRTRACTRPGAAPPPSAWRCR